MNTSAHPGTAAGSLPTSIAPALGRAMISVLFLISGISKVTTPAPVIGYIQSVGLPLPAIALTIAALVEIGGGLALVLGYRTRITASVLLLFTLTTAAVFHSHLADQNQLIHFFKNVAIAGGLLNIFAFGAGQPSLDGRRFRSGG